MQEINRCECKKIIKYLTERSRWIIIYTKMTMWSKSEVKKLSEESGNKYTVQEKKEHILMTALQEFSEKGYDGASTNLIVQRAGVSKGLLFHYFGNKRNLYLATFEMCFEKMLPYFNHKFLHVSSNIIERIMEISLLKLKIAMEQPLMHSFLTAAYIEAPEEVRDEIKTRYEQLTAQYMPYVLENIDYSLFKEDINREKALELIMIVLDAITEKYIKTYKKTEKKGTLILKDFVDELEDYLILLKHGIYK